MDDAVVKYKMDEMQTKAYCLCKMWVDLCKKEFPNERHTKLRKTGDPRRSHLFKCCYKLVRQTKGLIPDEEYKLYITAQLHIMKLQTDGEVHGLVTPGMLVGDKAWRRWRVWKKHYELEKIKPKTVEELDVNPSLVLVELNRTNGDPPKYERLEAKIKDLAFIRWVTVGKVSPYYVLLSPFVKRFCGGEYEEMFLFDFDVYKGNINDEVTAYFEREFDYEF
jgi:hypothetical protein